MKHFKVSNSLDHPIQACDQRKQIIERKKNGDENIKMIDVLHFVWKFIKKEDKKKNSVPLSLKFTQN